MPYIVMVIQSVIIFITLSAFILYVFSPRSIVRIPFLCLIDLEKNRYNEYRRAPTLVG